MRLKWCPETRDFVPKDAESAQKAPLMRSAWRSGVAQCLKCAIFDEEAVWKGENLPICAECGEQMVDVTDIVDVAAHIAVRGDYIPGGTLVEGVRYDTRSDMKRAIAEHEAGLLPGERLELISETPAQRDDRRHNHHRRTDEARKRKGYTTEGVKAVQAERKRAIAAGDTTADVVTKSVREILTGSNTAQARKRQGRIG